LVAGGVVTVGAASIISSPAFALTTPVPPTVTVENDAPDKVATFTVTLQDPLCSGSPLTGTVALVSASFVTPGSTGTISLNGQSLTALSTNQSGKFANGDTARVRVTTTSTCTYSNIPDESAAGGPYVFDFSYDGASWT
jgi:hypothetical protein